MRNPLRWLLGMGAGVVSFAYLIFVLNPVQMMSVVLVPFSRNAFRRVNRWCAQSIWGWWVLLAEVQNRTKVRFTGDRPNPRENAVVLSNHQSMLDVLLLLCLAWRCGRLGDLKVFVKNAVKYVPGVGWGMQFIDCIFVKRNWSQDASEIDRLFGKFKRDDIPVFLVSFLEGTRKTPEKLAQSQAFAKERGLYVPEHTLVPRTKGFVATVNGLRGHVDAIYDLTIGYHDDPAPKMLSGMTGDLRRVDLHLRRYAIADLPTADDELAEWARERFAEKDRLLAAFHENGKFPGPEWDADVRLFDWFRGPGGRSGRLTPQRS